MPRGFDQAQWAYNNYNCLNFYTGSGTTTSNQLSSTALIYPAPTSSKNGVINPYRPPGPFTFNFYINPRYNDYGDSGEYPAGTILHMSSCYAISLVTGSSVGPDGKPDGFRLLLQLSHSAGVPPDEIDLTAPNNSGNKSAYSSARGYPKDLVFLSSDNSLKHNHWHHVAVRWGADDIDEGSGSFHINNGLDSTFVVPSSSVITQDFPFAEDGNGRAREYRQPDALFVGNFFCGIQRR